MFGALAMLEQDIKNFFRVKWFLAGLVSMNLADLFIMATVFTRMVPFDYFRFVAPGIAVFALFAAAFLIGREVNWEARRGHNEYLLSLPVQRGELVLGRMLAGGIRGLLYASPLMTTAILIVGVPPASSLLAILGAMFMIGIGISGLAIALASTLKSFERFTTARAFLYYMLMFASSVFYPLSTLRGTIAAPVALFAQVNPLSLGADLFRAYLTGDPPLTFDLWRNLVAFSGVFFVLGTLGYFRALEHA